MKAEKLSLQEKIKVNMRGISLLYQMIPWNLFSSFFVASMDVLYSYWSYIFLARLVDDAVSAVPRDVLVKDVLLLVVGQTVVFIVMRICYHYYFYCASNIWELANTHLNKKIMEMDYEYMESETIQNRRRDIDAMARNGGGGMNMLFWYVPPMIEKTIHILIAFSYTIYLMSRCKVAFPGEPVKAVLFVSVFIGMFSLLMYLVVWKNKDTQKKIYRYHEETLPYLRQYQFYAEEYIGKEECGKNIRMFHQQNLLTYRIEELFYKLSAKFNSMYKLEAERNQWMGIIEALISGLIYFLLGIMVLKKAITIGSICLYAGCISNFLLHFREWVSQITELAANTKYVKMYFDFLDIPNKKYEGTLPVEKRDDDKFTIEFRHVSFRYPNTSKDVLKDFSIRFHIGERLAVVGKNGSGKTTFIKLLCRLYDPTEGEILLNGIDIRKYDYQEYLSLFSVVFQDFKIPALPLGQNVSASMEYDEESVLSALERVGLKDLVQRMPNGLDTPIYTDFDSSGADISGGEAQKVAIARALYHDTPFVILDEPTAALDPLAEYEIYANFDELVGTKTAVYISHRLSSCQFCNDILVIDEGRAVQRGNHNELVKEKDGLYYKLWNTQAQYYQVEE